MKTNGPIKVLIPVPMTDEELASAARMMADALSRISELECEAKIKSSEYRELINEIKASVKARASEVKSGTKLDQILACVSIDDGEVTYTDPATGEVLYTRAAKSQENLPMDEW